MEEIAQVIADRTDCELVKVREALDAADPETLWWNHVGPMLDAIQDASGLHDKDNDDEADSAKKRLYEFDMIVVVSRRERYTVEAESEEEARELAESGETVEEVPGEEIEVRNRIIDSGPTIVEGSST